MELVIVLKKIILKTYGTVAAVYAVFFLISTEKSQPSSKSAPTSLHLFYGLQILRNCFGDSYQS